MTTLSPDDPEAQAELGKMRKDRTDEIAHKQGLLKAAEKEAQAVAEKLGVLSASITEKQAILAVPKPSAGDFNDWPDWKAALSAWQSQRDGVEAVIAKLEAEYHAAAQSMNPVQERLETMKVEAARAELLLAQLEREIAQNILARRHEEERSANQALVQVQHATDVARQRRRAA